MPRSSVRADKVADAIQRELAELLQFELRDPRISLVSIHEVRVSADLGYAEVYYSRLDDPDEPVREAIQEALASASGLLRSRLASRIRMRTIPRLRFHYDLLPQQGARLERLIEDARADDDKRHESPAGPAPDRPEGDGDA